MEIARGTTDHHEQCLRIAQGLPEHFTTRGRELMADDLPRHELYIAKEGGEVVGFATVDPGEGDVAEITWMAVGAEHQGRGVGTALVERIASDMGRLELRELEVRTLAPEVDYPPYEATRRFWARRGFVHVETLDPYPRWGEGNPCAVLRRGI